jgi:hypothetical protein
MDYHDRLIITRLFVTQTISGCIIAIEAAI